DALRQAQAKAHAAFLHQPLVEAAVLQTIGVTFANLAEYAEGEKALRRALDLRVSTAGKRSPEAAESWTALAKMYLTQGEFDQGDTKRDEELAREGLALARALHPDRHMEIAEALDDYGVALTQVEKYPDAERAFLEALDIEHEVVGDDHPAMATTRENLGNV